MFSPTGTQVAFLELRAEKPTIAVMSIPDGRMLISLEPADGKGRFELAWLRDESAIAYTLSEVEGEANTLWIQSVDGGPPLRAANLGDEEISFLSFTAQPDSVAFIHGGWKHDVVMLSGLQ